MPVEVKIVIDDSKVKRTFKRLKSSLTDFRPVLAQIEAVTRRGIERNINNKGSNLPGRWGRVSSRYANWKKSKGFGSADMILTGRLVRKLTSRNRTGLTKRVLSIGVNEKHASWINYKKFNFWGWSKAMTRRNQKIMTRYVDRILQGSTR